MVAKYSSMLLWYKFQIIFHNTKLRAKLFFQKNAEKNLTVEQEQQYKPKYRVYDVDNFGPVPTYSARVD